MLSNVPNPFVSIGIREPSALSNRGAAYVARFEGFRSMPYNDAANNATIGFGHLLHYGPVTAADVALFQKRLTRGRALQMLRRDALIAAASVRKYINTPLSQPQFDALTDFAYNCGPYCLHGTEVAHLVNLRKFAELRAALAVWDRGSNGIVIPGLEARRLSEWKLFATGNYRA